MAATRKKKPTAKKPAAKKPTAAKKKPAPVAVKPAPAPPPPPPSPPPPPAPPPIDHGARIAEIWRRLEAFVTSIGAPPLALAGPATRKAIAEAEKAMGLTFPPDYRAALLVHDGQAAGSPLFPWMPGCAPLAPVGRIVELWKKLQKPAGAAKKKPEVIDPGARVKPGVARPGRIPIADGVFLDLDPGPTGVAGQLLATLDGRDPFVLDASFTAALERWASVLERQIWTYDPARHTVLPRAAPMFQGNPAGLFARR